MPRPRNAVAGDEGLRIRTRFAPLTRTGSQTRAVIAERRRKRQWNDETVNLVRQAKSGCRRVDREPCPAPLLRLRVAAAKSARCP